jgi:uroporphyrinogen-III synthase
VKALVTRPRDDAAPILAALQARGIEPVLAPMLTIQPEPRAASRLADALAGVQAILFTSANGVRAFAAATPRRELPAFTVGEASAASARMAGFRTVFSAAGDVGDLAELVASRLAPRHGALAHAAGSVTAGDLAGDLGQHGFVLRRIVLYHADPAQALDPETVTLLRNRAIEFALFFSPRTGASFVTLAQEAGIGELFGTVTALALSPAVAAAVSALSWRAILVASEPTQRALLDALDQALKREGTDLA